MEVHTFEAYYNKDSKVLILGSFPSVKSREFGFYYAHPQNRFWKVLSELYNELINNDIVSKKEFLKKHKIALYDVCYSCDIIGSSDNTIKNVKPVDLKVILNNSNIKKIFVNGRTAYNLYNKLIKNDLKKEAIYLPSTSPLNARYSLNDLVKEYKIIKED